MRERYRETERRATGERMADKREREKRIQTDRGREGVCKNTRESER